MSKARYPPEPLTGDTYTARVLKQYIWRRCNVKNEHFMGCIVGREGSGKSGTAIAIASVVDPTFDAGRIHFRPEKFLKELNEDRDRQGEILVLDESGVGLGVRSWYDKSQILVNKAMQVCRDENMGVIFTLPALEDLDSQSRRRLHAFMEMAELTEGKYSRFRWKNLDPTRDGRGELMRWYPRDRNGGDLIKKLQIGPPPQSIWEEYQDRKAEFQQELYEEAIESYEPDGPDKSRSPKEIAKQIMDNGGVGEYVQIHGGNGSKYIDWRLIRSEYDVSRGDAKTVKSILQTEVEI